MIRTIAQLLTATQAIKARIESRVELMTTAGEKLIRGETRTLPNPYTMEHVQQRENDTKELSRIRDEIVSAASPDSATPEMMQLLSTVERATEALPRERFAEVWFKGIEASWKKIDPLIQRFEAIVKRHDTLREEKWVGLPEDVRLWPIQKIMEAAAQFEDEEIALQSLFTDMLTLGAQDCKCAESLSSLVDTIAEFIAKTQAGKIGVAAAYRAYQEKGGQAS